MTRSKTSSTMDDIKTRKKEWLETISTPSKKSWLMDRFEWFPPIYRVQAHFFLQRQNTWPEREVTLYH